MKKLSLVFFIFYSIAVQAQTDDINDPFDLSFTELKNINVSSIDFTNRSLTESFASAYVITSDMVENMPMFTLGDYLEMLVPGLIVFPQGTRGSGLRARGHPIVNAKHTLALWDGHSLNSHTALGNMTIYHSPLLNDLQQVEIVHGPGSVKHGTGALSGYINFVPKEGRHHPGSRIDLDYGDVDGSKRLQWQYGTRYGVNRDFFVYAGFIEADGFSTDNDFGGSVAPVRGERNKFRNRDEIIMGDYDPSYKFSLNWTHNRFNLKTLFEHLEFNPGGLVTDTTSLTQKTTFSLQPKYTFQLPYNSSLELSSSVQLIDTSMVRENFIDRLRDSETGGRESAYELRGAYQSRYFNRHQLTLGGQYKWLSVDSRKHFFSADPNATRNFVDGDWQEYSFFVEDNFSLSDKATFIAGLRYDAAKFSENLSFDGRNQPLRQFRPDDISNVSPRLGFTYKTDNDYVLRAVYQEGFAYPALFQYPILISINEFLESQDLPTFPDRNPEVLKNFEIGLRGDLIKDKLSFDLTAYYNRFVSQGVFVNLRNHPSLLPLDALREFPEGMFGIEVELDDEIDAYGTELSLRWTPNNNLASTISYSYSVPDHISARDNQLVLVADENLSKWLKYPEHQLKADISYRHNNWLFSVAGIYQSGLDVSTEFAPGRENARDEYVRVNAGIGYKLNDRARISFIAKNVFGNNTPRVNADPTRSWQGSLGSDERLFYIGFSFDF